MRGAELFQSVERDPEKLSGQCYVPHKVIQLYLMTTSFCGKSSKSLFSTVDALARRALPRDLRHFGRQNCKQESHAFE